jgi:protein-tyrosine phosphatase
MRHQFLIVFECIMLQEKIGVLFVCLGNICRSPSAQGVFQHQVDAAGLSDKFIIDSCGTAPFNVGKSPDKRAIHATNHFGYNIEDQIARQITKEDYLHFDYIIPMDRKNMMSLTAWKPSDYSGEINLFMHYHADNLGETQIPDPYHDGPEKFIPIISVIEEASAGLLAHIRKKHQL